MLRAALVKICRLEIAASAMLREADLYLRTLRPPPLFFVTRVNECGDWRADVASGPPAADRPKPLAYRRQFLKAPVRLPQMRDDTIVSACNYYPVGGGGLGWHTDSQAPGWRIYIARPLGAHVGVLHVERARLMPEGQPLREAFTDEPGIATAFYVSGAPCASWHAVSTEGPRLSIGIRFRDGVTARALGLVS